MKLQEFFDRQKQTSFADIDKLDLYQNILYKQTRGSSKKRLSLIQAKYFVYMTIFVFLLVGVYGMYLFNGGNIQDNGRFSIIKNNSNTVQADYIAQVIEAKGNFFVEHNGVLTKTNNISNGDTLLLKEDTQLSFEIDNGTQSKIIGPAKLVVQKTPNESYKLNLVYGDFIEMEGNEQKTQTIELAINDITIKQEDIQQPVNFKFIKDGNNQIFQNNGANIIVTKSNGNEKTTTITKEQVISIQKNDIKIFANIESFTKAIQTKNVSQTFTLQQDSDIEKEIDNKEITSLLSLLTTNTSTTQEDKEEVTKEITSILGNEKKILDPKQDEQINNNLHQESYTTELRELENAFIKGDMILFDSAYNKIEKRIQNIYQSINIIYSKIDGEPTKKLQTLATAIKKINDKIVNDYTTPPIYSEKLQNIEKYIYDIINKKWESAAPIVENTTE